MSGGRWRERLTHVVGLLEFYSVHRRTIGPIIVTARIRRPYSSARRRVQRRSRDRFATLLGGCAIAPIGRPAAPVRPPPAPPLPRNAEPPPPPINLSGFPLPYRQGYADGCASAAGTERKDAGALRRRSELPHRLAGRSRALPEEERSSVRRQMPPSTSHFVDVRGAAPSRADVGRAAGAAALPAARMDGRRRVVPVPRRRACARLVCDRAGPARLRTLGMAGAGLLVLRLRRRSRGAARSLRAATSRCAWSATASAATS